jgi:hypothetical protein
MNIFYLSKDPKQCAEWMVDKHTIKMILESAQLLSTAHRLLDGKMTEIFTERAGKSYKKKVWVLPDRRESILYSNVKLVNGEDQTGIVVSCTCIHINEIFLLL